VEKDRKTTARKEQGNGVERHRAIDDLSTRYVGISEPAHHEEMYHLNTAAGKIHTNAFAADGTTVCEKE
jgi:hypothetical protein